MQRSFKPGSLRCAEQILAPRVFLNGVGGVVLGRPLFLLCLVAGSVQIVAQNYVAAGGGCTFHEDCNDGNVCTLDSCMGGVCVNSNSPNNTLACDDGLFCTQSDTCFNGVCAAGIIRECPDLGFCCETTSSCTVNLRSCPSADEVGACCLINGLCLRITEAECTGAEGSFLGVGSECPDGPCSVETTGACCSGENDCDCSIETRADCIALGGTYQGDGTTCVDSLRFLRFERLPGLIIIPNNPTTVENTITVTDSLSITDVNVEVEIDHTFLGDLEITLQHVETGTTVILWNNSCGDDDDMNVTFDDEGAALTCGSPTTGVFTPDQALSAFDGEGTAGDWLLRVRDGFFGDGGTFVRWALNIEGGNPCDTQPPVADGGCPPGMLTLECGIDEDPGFMPSFTDNCDSDLMVGCTSSTTIDVECPVVQSISRRCTATDDAGNEATCSQGVNIVDTTPPEVTCADEITLICDGPDGYSGMLPLTFEATDACDEELEIRFPAIRHPLPPTCGFEPHAFTAEAEDDCVNIGSCTTLIQVVGPMCCPGFADTDLTLLPVDMDLRQDTEGPVTTKAKFDVFNQNEVRFSGTERCITCWDQTLLSRYSAPNHFFLYNLHTDKGRSRIDGLGSTQCPFSEESPFLGLSIKELSYEGFVGPVMRSAIMPIGMGTQQAVIQYDVIHPPDTATAPWPTVGYIDPQAAGLIDFDPLLDSRSMEAGGRQKIPNGGTQKTPDDAIREVPESSILQATSLDSEHVASISKKGSLLIWPKVEVKWAPANRIGPGGDADADNVATGTVAGVVGDDLPDDDVIIIGTYVPIQDTFIDISNDFAEDVRVQFYFVNGDLPIEAVFAGDPPILMEREHPGWNNVDVEFELTANQPTYWSALTGQPRGVQPWAILDPGYPPGRPDMVDPEVRVVRGFVVAWAVSQSGEEISWNHLSGDATVINYRNGTAYDYNAWAFQCVGTPTEGLACDGNPGRLNLDGVEYDYAPDKLIFDFYSVGSTALSNPEIIFHR